MSRDRCSFGFDPEFFSPDILFHGTLFVFLAPGYFLLVLGEYPRITRYQLLTRWTVCMKTMIILLGVCLLAACAPVTENTPGEVFTMGDEELIIVGPKRDGKPAYPTNRMFEQAKSVCSSAYFINARPSLSKPSSFDYLFRC